MELIPLTTTHLQTLANRDPELREKFVGVFAADRLPPLPLPHDKGLIINTDPHDKPGQHWLAAWIKGNQCEVFDSYGLPLETYNHPDLQAFFRRYKYLTASSQTLQALDSMACGHYTLAYLKHKARGNDLRDFLTLWDKHDFVANDERVAATLKDTVLRELYPRRGSESCVSCRKACDVIGCA